MAKATHLTSPTNIQPPPRQKRAPTSWKMPVPCQPSPMVPVNWFASRSRNRSLGNWPGLGLGSGPLQQGRTGAQQHKGRCQAGGDVDVTGRWEQMPTMQDHVCRVHASLGGGGRARRHTSCDWWLNSLAPFSQQTSRPPEPVLRQQQQGEVGVVGQPQGEAAPQRWVGAEPHIGQGGSHWRAAGLSLPRGRQRGELVALGFKAHQRGVGAQAVWDGAAELVEGQVQAGQVAAGKVGDLAWAGAGKRGRREVLWLLGRDQGSPAGRYPKSCLAGSLGSRCMVSKHQTRPPPGPQLPT